MMRWVLAVFYGVAGYLHIAHPAPFISIMPPGIPLHAEIVFLTGLAEIAGAIGLAQPWRGDLRRAAGIGLACYAACVWPANINHFVLDMVRPDGGLGLTYHVPRMLAQPILIWLALWTGGATRWPLRNAPDV